MHCLGVSLLSLQCVLNRLKYAKDVQGPYLFQNYAEVPCLAGTFSMNLWENDNEKRREKMHSKF